MMDQQEHQWLFTLSKDPRTWTKPDVDSLCQIFKQQIEDENQLLDAKLVSRLWRFWFFVHGESPLMEEPKHNLALMIAAQAFGEFVPISAKNDFFVQYRKQYEQFEYKLFPEKLHWGVNAILSHPNAALEATTSTICILRENDQIQEISLIGENLPQIREMLFDMFFGCALRMQTDELDMMNLGGYRLLLESAQHDPLDLPVIGRSSGSIFSRKSSDRTSLDLFEDLARQVRQIQTDTGFVSVWNCDAHVKAKFDQMIRDQVKDCHQSGTTMVIALNPEIHPEIQGLITHIPYYQFGNRPRPLKVVLPIQIIEQQSFNDLLASFKYHTIDRIVVDAEVRLTSYEKHAHDLGAEKKRWDEASVELRKGLWGESVTVTEKFIVETGTTVALAQPHKLPVETYMREHMPNLISYYASWAERMRTVIKELKTATTGPNNTFKHIAINLFLDMALREKPHYFENRQIHECFEKWFRQVGPFLRYTWRTALESKNIPLERIFNRHTIFNTQFLLNEAGLRDGLIIQPFAAIIPATSIIVLDSVYGVIRVLDMVDFSQPLEVTSSSPSDVLWKEFEELLARPDNGNQFAQLVDFLGEHPFDLFPYLLHYINNNWQKPPNAKEWEEIEKIVMEKNEQNKIPSFPSLISTYLGQGAYHSARELCRSISVPPQLRKNILLWHVLTECLARGISPHDIVPRVFRSGHAYPDDQWLAKLLSDAKILDPSFTEQWVTKVEAFEELGVATRFLTENWPKMDDQLATPEEIAYWKASIAVEAFRLSRQLSADGTEINVDGESTDTMFSKLGYSLENILLSGKGVTAFSDVYALLEILQGREKPTHTGSES